MSNDEQMAAIGKLTVERAQAKREMALLSRTVKDLASLLLELGQELKREQPPSNIGVASLALDKIIEKGGIDSLRESMRRYIELEQRVAEISKSLSSAGAE